MEESAAGTQRRRAVVHLQHELVEELREAENQGRDPRQSDADVLSGGRRRASEILQAPARGNVVEAHGPVRDHRQMGAAAWRAESLVGLRRDGERGCERSEGEDAGFSGRPDGRSGEKNEAVCGVLRDGKTLYS